MKRILGFSRRFCKIQSKELLAIARKPIAEKGKTRKGIGPNTVYYYLDKLIQKGFVNKLPADPDHPKDVYYSTCKKPKDLLITEQAINEVKKLFEEFPKEIERMIELELATYREYSEEPSKEEENEVYMQISQDQDEIEYRLVDSYSGKRSSFLKRHNLH